MTDAHMPFGLPDKLNSVEMDDEHDLTITKYIQSIDPELRDRFKALHTLQCITKEMDEEETEGIRKLELEFEEKYKQIYATRELLINGKSEIDSALVKAFDETAEKLKDDDYDKLEVVPCDVKSIQNIPKGVCDFWVKAMINHKIGSQITEKDRPILGYLTNIELDLHSSDKGYDLIFSFGANNYFSNLSIKKSVQMKTQGVVDSTTSTPIDWKDNCDPTKKKTKKKKKGKKVTVEVKCDSFFNFFTDIVPDDAVKNAPAPKKDEDEEGEFDNLMEEMNERLYEDQETANDFKDDLIPLALEYYLGVIEKEDEEDFAEEGEEEDSNDDKPKPKPKKGKKGGDAPEMPLGPDGKPQECKQQ